MKFLIAFAIASLLMVFIQIINTLYRSSEQAPRLPLLPMCSSRLNARNSRAPCADWAECATWIALSRI